MRLPDTLRHTLRRMLNLEFSSSIVRAFLGRYYRPGKVYRVLFGDLRGTRLKYDGQMTFHSMLGLLDRKNFRFLARALNAAGVLRPGMVVADVGANVGIYSLWFSRLLAPYGGARIYAFEPAPSAGELLSYHVAANSARDVEWVPLGISDRVGQAEFFITPNHAVSSLYREHASGAGEMQSVQIRTTTFEDFFGDGRECPDFIKIDIEGAAAKALQRVDGCIEKKRPVFLIESHDISEDQQIASLAVRHRYRGFRLNNLKWVKDYQATHPNPDGVWGNLLFFPEELCARVESVLPC
jgi:FkbM family methyltransferase